MVETANFIDGTWCPSESGETFDVHDPANPETVVGTFPASTAVDVRAAIDAATDAADAWGTTPAPQRGAILRAAAQELDADREALAELLVREEGKTQAEAAGEVNRAVEIFYYYAEKTRELGGVRKPTSQRDRVLEVRAVPLGTVALITPWNFPIAIPAWKLAPALAAGNTVLLKPASDAPHMAAALVMALDAAGLPDGVVNLVTGSGSVIGGELTTNPAIDAVSFTGSTAVGTSVANQAAEQLTRVQCEMGGKNPTVVMPSADLGDAVEIVASGGFGTTGQSCTACSRAIVHTHVVDAFTDALVQKAEALTVGPGLSGADMGPQVNESELTSTLGYVERADLEGAIIATGGERVEPVDAPDGHFIAPTVIADVAPHSEIAQSEVFGPVIAVISVDSFDEAIDVANDVPYGLSASIVTGDLSEAHRFTDRAEAGVVKINEKTTGLELHAPFGGFKDSSTNTYREQGEAGLDFFSATKTVYINY
jgi:aldehyde dehydrogenase (NAD+)